MSVLAALSYSFPYGVVPTEAPLGLYVCAALLVSAGWVGLAVQLRRTGTALPALWILIGLGLVMRGLMFFSLPVLEDDSYRYLWDGAVTANGVAPYKYVPAEYATDPVLGTVQPETSAPDAARLQALADRHVEPHSRINFPYVSTIYPPLAQAAFAAAYFIDPFGLTGWRWVLLISDLITLGLLLKLLRAYGRPAIWVSLYWWNPVDILQGFGAAHMDLLVLPFLLLALLLHRSQRTGLAALALAGGAAVKIWPVLLVPFLLRPFLNQPIKALTYASLFVVSAAILLLPQALHALSPEAGLNAYASDWRTHSFLFAFLEDILLAPIADPGRAARVVVGVIMIGLIAVLALKYAKDDRLLPGLWAVVIAVLIFLSPTGYPWYFIWLAPLLPFLPRLGLIALIALAPLYWLRFQFGDDALIYQWGVVPIAFGVPLALLLLPHLNKRVRDAIGHHHPRFE